MTYPCVRDDLLLAPTLTIGGSQTYSLLQLGMDPLNLVCGIRVVEPVRVDGREVCLHHVLEENGNGCVDSVRHHVATVCVGFGLHVEIRVVARVVSGLIVAHTGRRRLDVVALLVCVGTHGKKESGSRG